MSDLPAKVTIREPAMDEDDGSLIDPKGQGRDQVYERWPEIHCPKCGTLGTLYYPEGSHQSDQAPNWCVSCGYGVEIIEENTPTCEWDAACVALLMAAVKP